MIFSIFGTFIIRRDLVIEFVNEHSMEQYRVGQFLLNLSCKYTQKCHKNLPKHFLFDFNSIISICWQDLTDIFDAITLLNNTLQLKNKNFEE